MSYEGINNIPREGLVYEALLDGSVPTGSTSTNVTYTPANNGYVSEVGNFNGSAYINAGKVMSGLTSATMNFAINANMPSKIEEVIGEFDNSGYTNNFAFDYVHTAYSVGSRMRFIISGGDASLLREQTYDENLFFDNTPKFIQIDFISSTSINLYINGEYITPTTTSGTVPANIYNSVNGFFGIGRGNTTSRGFTGQIGLVRIYDKALTESERFSLYTEYLRKIGNPLFLPLSEFTTVTDGLVFEDALNGSTIGTPSNLEYSSVWGGEVGEFNGTNAYINYGNDSIFENSGNSMTISIVARWEKNPTLGTHILDRNGYGGNGYRFMTGGSGTFRFNSANFNAENPTVPSLNQYYHIICKHIEGVGQEVWFDGVLVGTDNYTGSLGTNSSDFIIGARATPFGFFGGEIALFKMYNKATTEEEDKILQMEANRYIYSQKYTPNSLPKPVLHLDGTNNGTTFYDQSGNGNDGIINGTTFGTIGQNTYMNFDGSNDYINFGDVSDLEFAGGDFTFSCSLRWTSSPTIGTHIIDKNGYIANGYRIFTGGSGTIRLNVNTVNVDSLFVPTVGDYYKLDVVHNNLGDSIIYINGNVVATVNSNTSLGSNSANCELGRRNAGIGYFPGDIINPTFQNQALSSGQIKEDFYSNFISN